MNNEITLSNQEVVSIIGTLKQIKPRGFDSMNRVVGLVMFLESKLNQQPDPVKQMAEVTNNGTD